MIYNLYLLKFNPMFNNYCKRFENLSDYDSYVKYTKTNFNFKFGDGVSSEVVIMDNTLPDDLDVDYALIQNTSTNEFTRWFVIPGSSKLIGGKFSCQLNRDSVADFYDDILESKAYIERGWVADTNPLIFNQEQISVNQIKQKQIPINDSANSWIAREHLLMFIDRKWLNSETGSLISVTGKYIEDYSLASLSNYVINGVHLEEISNDYLTVDLMRKEDLKIIKTQDNKYYQISFINTSTMANNYSGKLTTYELNINLMTFTMGITQDSITLYDKEPYVVISLPFTDTSLWNRTYSLMCLQAIREKLGTAIYDIQITPYHYYKIINSKVYRHINCFDSSGSEISNSDSYLRIVKTEQVSQTDYTFNSEITASETIKEQSICDLFRIYSPTSVNSYEFDIGKYNNEVKFEISSSFKPYNSIVNIKMIPTNNSYKLIANQFGDNIELTFGLISFSNYTDAWTQYELNNKNYKEVFENTLKLQVINATAGAIGNSINGFKDGFVKGGATGGILGGTAANFGSAVSGVGLAIGQEFTKKNFELQLGNIKAQPRSLSSISKEDFSYKKLAYLTYYSCTRNERILVNQYLNFNSYNINFYNCTVSDFINTDTTKYTKLIGRITYSDNIPINNYIDINNKLNQGVFIKLY